MGAKFEHDINYAPSATRPRGANAVQRRSLSYLSDPALLRNLTKFDGQDRATTIELIAYVGEVERRRLHVPAGYKSMHAFCVGKLHWSEDVAFKRIRAARISRRFPEILERLADGRLHLSSVALLAPHLTRENAGKLMDQATYLTRKQTECLVAARFPKPDLPARITPLGPLCAVFQQAPGPVGCEPHGAQLEAPTAACSPQASAELASGNDLLAAQAVMSSEQAPGPVVESSAAPVLAAPVRYGLQLTISQSTHDKLRYLQELLGNQIAPGDLAAVLDRALDALAKQLERTRFGASSRPRDGATRTSANPRHIPSRIKHAVWKRDLGQCTFTSDNGHRCEARGALEFDHIEPVTRGGAATVDNLRLRCRTHNQYEAERLFGEGFMQLKREQARTWASAKSRALPDEQSMPAAPA